jgi:nitroimidazol reductase NimA-like FMN-containing flavoprotein (pyridoxamine 5'-phosphate oxidase superfamily)
MAAIAELMDHTTLDRVECLRLLASGEFGRVVCTDGALPTAEPVSYVLDREEIVFRAPAGGRLVTAVRNAVVAFQADSIDGEAGHGWSVLGIGRAYEVSGARRLAEMSSKNHRGTGIGHCSVIMAVPLWRLSGRRLRLSDVDREPVGSV